MDFPKSSTILPPFEWPTFFTHINNQFTCTICPPPASGARHLFRTPKTALAHERTKKHSKLVAEAMADPWAHNNPDWGSEPAKETDWLSPEQLKDLEYRKRNEQIPEFVSRWQSTFADSEAAGEMLPVDAPPINPNRGRNRWTKRKAKNKVKQLSIDTSTQPLPTTAAAAVSSAPRSQSIASSSEDDESTNPSDIDHMAVRKAAMAKSKTIRETERRARAVNMDPIGPTGIQSLGLTRPNQSIGKESTAFSPLDLDCSDERQRSSFPPWQQAFNPSPSVTITPELRAWMDKLATARHFSPQHMQRMQAFIQLPTDSKISLIRHSVGEVRALIHT